MTETLVTATQIRRDFRTPGGTLEILRGVDLEIRRGEMCYVLGRSGAGKSTLLHILASLDRPSGGKVLFAGEDLSTLGESALARYRNEKVGFIFQFYHLLPELTLLENVMLPRRIARKRDGRRRAVALLEKVGLAARAAHFPNQLSGGEQQRAAIARALVNDPEIVFCDEPTGNLDEETAEAVFDLILGLNQTQGQTFCIVTHEEVLVRESPSVYYLHEGRLSPKLKTTEFK